MLLKNAVRTVVDSEPGMQARERARTSAEHQAEQAKTRIGEMILDAVEGYFPEQAKKRRRRGMRRGFALGMIVGFVAGVVLGGENE